MNNRPILWVLFVAIALPATCVAQDSVPARGEAKNAAAPSRLSGNRSEARQELRPTAENAAESLDDFRVFGQPPNPPAAREVGRPLQETDFFEDSRRTATETSARQEPMLPKATLPIPKVLEPNGQPIEAFTIYGFSGDTVTLPAPGLPPQANAEMQPSKPLFEHEGDTFGSPPEFNLPANVTSVLIIAPEGFKVVGKKSLLQEKPITLESVAKVKGKVELNGPAVKNAFVTASWHSFPFHPELLSLPTEKRREGPGLFLVTSRADLNEDGTFELGVPSGGVRFSVVQVDSNSPDLSRQLGLHWWETVEPVAVTDDTNKPQQLPPHTFDLMTVTGRLKQTDALAEKLTQVKQVDGQVEVSQIPLFMHFSNLSGATSIRLDDDPYTRRSLQDVIRRAAIWGRPGGGREQQGSVFAAVPIPDNGQFSFVVASEMDSVSLSKRVKFESNDGVVSYGYHGFTSWHAGLNAAEEFDSVSGAEDTLFGQFPVENVQDPANVTVDADGNKVVDLGEIDLSNFLADDFAEPSYQRHEQDAFDRPYDEMPERATEDAVRGTAWKDDIAPLAHRDVRAADWNRRPEPDTAPSPEPFFNVSPPVDRFPDSVIPRPRTQPTTDNPTDRAIAELVAQLLNAGDSRVRQTMKEPLKKLLQQRFDAEQKAREQLLEELRKRFDTATQQVKDRATKRDKIINDQLQRMLSLPEDDFEILPQQKPPANDAYGTDAIEE